VAADRGIAIAGNANAMVDAMGAKANGWIDPDTTQRWRSVTPTAAASWLPGSRRAGTGMSW
jgi:hypothetical protein